MIVLRNETSIIKVPEDVKQLFSEVIAAYVSTCDNDVLEIRLLGSIPRGHAVKKVSDVDFLCILKDDGAVDLKDELLEYGHRFSEMLPDYAGVDLGVTNQGSLDDHFDYKLLVMTDSICIHGENEYWVPEYEICGTELANLWNPNPIHLLKEYRKRFSGISHPDEIKVLEKLIGKDFIKAFRPILMRIYSVFSRSIKGSCDDLCRHDEKNHELYKSLYALYANHEKFRIKTEDVLNRVENYIDENRFLLFPDEYISGNCP